MFTSNQNISQNHFHKLSILLNLLQPKGVPSSHFHQPADLNGAPHKYLQVDKSERRALLQDDADYFDKTASFGRI